MFFLLIILNRFDCCCVGQKHLFYLTTHDYVVILCVPPTFGIPAFVVVVWVREVSQFSRRKASVYVQAVVWCSVSSMDVVGDDLGVGLDAADAALHFSKDGRFCSPYFVLELETLR
jgi:hypothetical protein